MFSRTAMQALPDSADCVVLQPKGITVEPFMIQICINDGHYQT